MATPVIIVPCQIVGGFVYVADHALGFIICNGTDAFFRGMCVKNEFPAFSCHGFLAIETWARNMFQKCPWNLKKLLFNMFLVILG